MVFCFKTNSCSDLDKIPEVFPDPVIICSIVVAPEISVSIFAFATLEFVITSTATLDEFEEFLFLFTGV